MSTGQRRILLLTTDLLIGGTPTVVRELSLRLRQAGVQVSVACLSQWGPTADQLTHAGIPVTALGAKRITDFFVLPRLVRLIRRGRFDTVFSFLIHANAIAAAASPFCRDVRFFQAIQSSMPNPNWHWRLQSIIHQAAKRMIAPSASVAEALTRWSSIPRQQIVIVPNAIEPAHFPASPIAQANPRPYPIGFIGRLEPVKRVPDLVEAVRLLGGLVRLSIFGYGPEERAIQAMIHRLHIEPLVELRGPIARPQDALQQIGLLVLPSSAEGFGLVLIEAMAAGVPVVATNVEGIRDVVRADETGLLVPPAAPGELAEAIRRLVVNGPLRQALVHNARQDVLGRFTWDAILPQYLNVLYPDIG